MGVSTWLDLPKGSIRDSGSDIFNMYLPVSPWGLTPFQLTRREEKMKGHKRETYGPGPKVGCHF